MILKSLMPIIIGVSTGIFSTIVGHSITDWRRWVVFGIAMISYLIGMYIGKHEGNIE